MRIWLTVALGLTACGLSPDEVAQSKLRCAEWRDAHAPGGEFTCSPTPGNGMHCEVSGPTLHSVVAVWCDPVGCSLRIY